MNYYLTEIKVRTSGPRLEYFLAEDLKDQTKIYTIGRSACLWYDSIHIEDKLKVVAQSNGEILSVVERISEKEEDLRNIYKRIRE